MCIWKHWIFSNATILVVCVVNNRERLLYFVSHSLSWYFPSFFSIASSPPTPLSLSFSHKNNIFNVCFDKSTPRFSYTNLLVPKICFFFDSIQPKYDIFASGNDFLSALWKRERFMSMISSRYCMWCELRGCVGVNYYVKIWWQNQHTYA